MHSLAMRILALGVFVLLFSPAHAVLMSGTESQSDEIDLDRLERSRRDQVNAIIAQWESANRDALKTIQSATTKEEIQRARRAAPDRVQYWRRSLDLAKASPNDSACRDALLWIIRWPGTIDHDGTAAELERDAVQILLEHHAVDPSLAGVAFELSDRLSRNRESLLRGVVQRGCSGESAGLARLALGRYLLRKASDARDLRGDGGAFESIRNQHPLNAYRRYLVECDVDATSAEAVSLLREVMASHKSTRFERPGGERLKRRPTLGDAAESLLDEHLNLAIGKPLPAITGKDLAGRPLNLCDYRGKVVVIVFWASWCGPCVEDMANEQRLVDRLQHKPFALLGVNCDADLPAAIETIESNHISWPNWNDPYTEEGEGPISNKLHIRQLPATFVLDGQGNIRAKNYRGERLERVVEQLLAEIEMSQ